MGFDFDGCFWKFNPGVFIYQGRRPRSAVVWRECWNALTPLFTILVGFIWLKINPSKQQVYGIIVGLISAVFLMLFERGDNLFRNVQFGLLLVIATLCYAISVNGIRKYLWRVKFSYRNGLGIYHYRTAGVGVFVWIYGFYSASCSKPKSAFFFRIYRDSSHCGHRAFGDFI